MGEEELEADEDMIQVVELLKEACLGLQRKPSSRECMLKLETIVSSHPHLHRLCVSLSSFISLGRLLHATPHHSFVHRRLTSHQISRLASSIHSELQAWLDRQLVGSLLQSFHSALDSDSDSELHLIPLLSQFQQRLSQGFNPELQEVILKSTLLSQLETIVANPAHSICLREAAAFSIQALISFNKNVFVAQVVMGPTTEALISMATPSSLRVLCFLITSIKSPLVDEIHANGLIPTIIGFLSSSSSMEMQVTALECVMAIGYYGRKEAVEAMLDAGVVETLLHLQTSTCTNDDNDVDVDTWQPFGECVASFAVQLEVGQGLRQREKRAFKHLILRRLRDACLSLSLSQAEAATIQAQVLWGSFT